MSTHQVAVRLDSVALEILKRRAANTRQPYATVISRALAALEQADTATASQPTSDPLVVYAYLPGADRQPIKDLVRKFRKEGRSYSAISKYLYRQYRLSGTDSLPLGASTIRGMCAM